MIIQKQYSYQDLAYNCQETDDQSQIPQYCDL